MIEGKEGRRFSIFDTEIETEGWNISSCYPPETTQEEWEDVARMCKRIIEEAKRNPEDSMEGEVLP